ncbi:MAG: hypothetical protein SOW80_11615 [Anaerovoracaceae bacterium]|nr:hypothetical protein [Anaerovoracaceae bacterium]
MNPYLDTRYCDVRCTFQVIDLTAKEDAAPSSSSEANISQIMQTIDDVKTQSIKLATLETNQWTLDGSMEIMKPLDEMQTGWWSGEISDENGDINTYLEFDFTDTHSSYGLTLYFDEKSNTYPIKFTITAYDAAGENIAEFAVNDNKDARYVAIAQLSDYKKIRITFAKTNLPHRRVRVTEVIFGIVEEFDRDNTVELSVTKEVDFSSESIPIGEIDLTFDNSNQRYNMVSPDGAYRFLKTGMPLLVEIGCGPEKDEIEYEKIGEFFYVSSESDDGALTAKITAQDILMYLERIDYPVPEGEEATIEEVTSQIQSAVKRIIDFEIEEELKSEKIMNLKPDVQAKCRAVLQQACQALRAVCYVSKQGKVVIKRTKAGIIADTLTMDKMLDVPKITTKERINTMAIENGEIIGTYQDKQDDEVIQSEKKSNQMITAVSANNVAKWMLENTRRLLFDIGGRGNPMHELTDTVKVMDAFGTERNVLISKHTLKFNGGLTEEIQARTVE